MSSAPSRKQADEFIELTGWTEFVDYSEWVFCKLFNWKKEDLTTSVEMIIENLGVLYNYDAGDADWVINSVRFPWREAPTAGDW